MTEPPKAEDDESKSDSIKSRNKLAMTKSLGFLDSARVSTSPENDDEYVEMDPVYAEVAPDEQPSEGNDSKPLLHVHVYFIMYLHVHVRVHVYVT